VESKIKKIDDKVSKIFGENDDEDDKEEMPFEAKVKMRNIGR
jgi:predicted phosphodiesterase